MWVVGDTGFADFASGLRTFGTADAMGRLFAAGQVFDIAGAVDLGGGYFAGGEVDFDMPIVAATAFGKDDVFGEPFGGILIPYEIDPYNLAAGEIGETYILPFVFAHVFVDDRAIAFLVDMVAVDVGDTFLDETFGFGNVFFGWGVATVLVFDGEVDIPSFVEGIAMVVATVDFFIVPSFDGDDIILSVGHAKDCHDHS